MVRGRTRRLLKALSEPRFWRLESLPESGRVPGLPRGITVAELEFLCRCEIGLQVFRRLAGELSAPFPQYPQVPDGLPTADGVYIHVRDGAYTFAEAHTRARIEKRRIRMERGATSPNDIVLATLSDIRDAIYRVLAKYPPPGECLHRAAETGDAVRAGIIRWEIDNGRRPKVGGMGCTDSLWSIQSDLERIGLTAGTTGRGRIPIGGNVIEAELERLVRAGKIEKVSASEAGRWRDFNDQEVSEDVYRLPLGDRSMTAFLKLGEQRDAGNEPAKPLGLAPPDKVREAIFQALDFASLPKDVLSWILAQQFVPPDIANAKFPADTPLAAYAGKSFEELFYTMLPAIHEGRPGDSEDTVIANAEAWLHNDGFRVYAAQFIGVIRALEADECIVYETVNGELPDGRTCKTRIVRWTTDGPKRAGYEPFSLWVARLEKGEQIPMAGMIGAMAEIDPPIVPPMSRARRTGRKGRKPKNGPDDQLILEAWGTGNYRTCEDCGRELGIAGNKVRKVVARQNKREARRIHRENEAKQCQATS